MEKIEIWKEFKTLDPTERKRIIKKIKDSLPSKSVGDTFKVLFENYKKHSSFEIKEL